MVAGGGVRMTRREWIGGMAAVAVLRAKPLGLPIGCQTYPVRQALNADIPGTLADLKASGFETIEMCSPPGYGRDYSAWAKMSGAEMKRTIEAAGLKCYSCHYSFKELKESLDERIAFAKEAGLRQMVLSSFGMPATAKLADWSAAADTLNGIAEKIRKAGMDAGYHNHTFEFQQLEGKLIYDELLGRFDPKLVGLQFQTAVISVGYKTADYFEKYPGRFLSMHIADWSSAEKKQVPMGKGEIDWKRVFADAKKAGVKNYFLEMNLDLMKESLPYLRLFT
jgi:sugar phosphate isomerase/epimerase